MTAPRSPEEYGAGFTDQELEADGWAVGLDVWGQVQKAYELYLGDATLANSQLYSLQRAILRSACPPNVIGPE